ncbi:WecB/TagA/CpsF family glycosyltransferase [Sphingomonas nostoxanthinifaciens]|nr:WecB/TagA/CpsF family glycosyltransferase [Sphingomonas nostoxanthinifaciens]
MEFLDLDFAQLSLEETLAWLARRGADAPFAYVVTPNVDHMVRFQQADDAVARAYREADLCVCDSRILARLAAFHGVDLPLVPGSDLTRLALERVFRPGDRLCLIGGTPDMPAKLEQRFRGLAIIQHLPPMGLRQNAAARQAAIDAAAAADARAVLIAVGAPQQELLAWEMRASGRVTGTALCIGASIDFLTGAQRRAPRLVQRAGMEWAWRLASQPRRLWQRYLVDGPAIFPIVRRWARARRAGHG